MAGSGKLGKLTFDIAANVASLQQDVGQVKKQLDRMSSASKKTAQEMDAISKSVSGFKKLAVGVTAMVAGFKAASAATRVFREAFNEAIDTGDRIAKTADKVGLTTDALQELRHAGEMTGVATGSLDIAMQRFSRRVGEVANGSGVLKDVFKDLGIEVKNNDGSLKSNEQLLGEYANAIKNAGSEQEQLLLAFKAFDTEGAALVNTLRNGSDGLDKMRKEARDLGLVLDENLLRQAEATKDELFKIGSVTKTTLTETFVKLGPTVLKVADAFNEMLMKIQPIMESGFDTFLDKMAGAFEYMAKFVEEDVTPQLNNAARAFDALKDPMVARAVDAESLRMAMSDIVGRSPEQIELLSGKMIDFLGLTQEELQKLIDLEKQSRIISGGDADTGGETGEKPQDPRAAEIAALREWIAQTTEAHQQALAEEEAFQQNLTAIVEDQSKARQSAYQMEIQSLQNAASVLGGIQSLLSAAFGQQEKQSAAFFYAQRAIAASMAFVQYQQAAAMAAGTMNLGLAAFYEGLSIAVPAAIMATALGGGPPSTGGGGSGGGTSIPVQAAPQPAASDIISGAPSAQYNITFNGPILGDKEVLARELVPDITKAIEDGVR